MRNVVLEIDGERHRLVPIRSDEVSCGMCSLQDYCMNQTKSAVLYCQELDKLMDEEHAKKYCMHFILER